MKTINFRNQIQVVLFRVEILGQISDGNWENSRPYDHWRYWIGAEVKVNPANLGRNFYAVKDNYNLTDPGLIEAVGERMCWYAALAKKGYDVKVIRDLGDYEDYFARGSKGDYWQERDTQMKEIFGSYENLCKEREGYSVKELRKELRDMKEIIRKRVG